MVRINPDPHARSYEYTPTKAITAFFPAGTELDPVLHTLAEAGFDRERINVFTGPEGAERLDPEGSHHGWWVRFRKRLEEHLSEDGEIPHRAEKTLRAGGSVIEVFTHGDRALKARAAEILKAAGGRDVVYWGPLVTEYIM